MLKINNWFREACKSKKQSYLVNVLEGVGAYSFAAGVFIWESFIQVGVSEDRNKRVKR